MDRPTLEEQIRVSKMTDEECIDALIPHTFWGRIDFWLDCHCPLLWRILHWNWFNIYTGESGVVKFAKHGFKEWSDNE
jgi:hypothetical protein